MNVDTPSQIALSIYVYSLVVFYFDYTVSYMYRGLTVHGNSSSITQKQGNCCTAVESGIMRYHHTANVAVLAEISVCTLPQFIVLNVGKKIG